MTEMYASPEYRAWMRSKELEGKKIMEELREEVRNASPLHKAVDFCDSHHQCPLLC